MAEPEWELLTVRGLGMTDESAAEFVGTFVIHRVGSPEPVEQVQIRVKRIVLEEITRRLELEPIGPPARPRRRAHMLAPRGGVRVRVRRREPVS